MTTRHRVRPGPSLAPSTPVLRVRLPLAKHSTPGRPPSSVSAWHPEMGRPGQRHCHISPSTAKAPAPVVKGSPPHRRPRAPSPGPQTEQGGLSAAPGRVMPATWRGHDSQAPCPPCWQQCKWSQRALPAQPLGFLTFKNTDCYVIANILFCQANI